MPGDDKKTCFIAMPITTHDHEVERYGGDRSHWEHVMETLFVKAVEAAGFEAIRPVASGSDMIHGAIIKHLSTADMVLCDLSSHNPNVFFELGVRTSLNLPIALVAETATKLPFDTAGINTHFYSPSLHGWEIEDEVARLQAHISASEANNDKSNPLWKHFGLTIAATKPDTHESAPDAKLELIYEGMQDLRRRVERVDLATRRTGTLDEARLNVKRVREVTDPEADPVGIELEHARKVMHELRTTRDAEVALGVQKILDAATNDHDRAFGSSTATFQWPLPGESVGEAQFERVQKFMSSRGYRLREFTVENGRLLVVAANIRD